MDKTEKAMIRIGKCVDSISNVLNLYDNEHGVSSSSGHHTLASEQKDLELIIQLLSSRVKPFRKKQEDGM